MSNPYRQEYLEKFTVEDVLNPITSESLAKVLQSRDEVYDEIIIDAKK
jgi:hypothetical protein